MWIFHGPSADKITHVSRQFDLNTCSNGFRYFGPSPSQFPLCINQPTTHSPVSMQIFATLFSLLSVSVACVAVGEPEFLIKASRHSSSALLFILLPNLQSLENRFFKNLTTDRRRLGALRTFPSDSFSASKIRRGSQGEGSSSYIASWPYVLCTCSNIISGGSGNCVPRG